jgi:hypothetical protein
MSFEPQQHVLWLIEQSNYELLKKHLDTKHAEQYKSAAEKQKALVDDPKPLQA